MKGRKSARSLAQMFWSGFKGVWMSLVLFGLASLIPYTQCCVRQRAKTRKQVNALELEEKKHAGSPIVVFAFAIFDGQLHPHLNLSCLVCVLVCMFPSLNESSKSINPRLRGLCGVGMSRQRTGKIRKWLNRKQCRPFLQNTIEKIKEKKKRVLFPSFCPPSIPPVSVGFNGRQTEKEDRRLPDEKLIITKGKRPVNSPQEIEGQCSSWSRLSSTPRIQSTSSSGVSRLHRYSTSVGARLRRKKSCTFFTAPDRPL